MNALPTVSVILPTYNRGGLLEQAVRSVLQQTFAGWELIVIDDGSTDDTRTFVLGLNDSRVQLVSLAHSGNPAWVRSSGLARARGEWIAFLDSDDLWFPSKLEWILEPLLAFAATASVTTLMIRRSLLDDVGDFDETLLSREDHDMMLRLASHAEIWAVAATTVARALRDSPGLPAVWRAAASCGKRAVLRKL